MAQNALLKKIIFFLLFLLLPLCVFSESSFYWESPRALTSVDSRFPVAVSDGNTPAVFFEEVEKAHVWTLLPGMKKKSGLSPGESQVLYPILVMFRIFFLPPCLLTVRLPWLS